MIIVKALGIVAVMVLVVYAGIGFVLGHNVLTEGWWE